MGSGMPEIGSRISLISKADIRYEGKLFAVDPEECTIALSSVRSYGTEDRETAYPVPAQGQLYDYILFRGSDIKDIRVLTTTIPNDPAIVQLSVPPSLNDPQFQSRTGYPQPPMTSMTMPNAPSTSRQSQTFQSSGFSTNSGNVNVIQPLPKSQGKTQQVTSEEGSRSSTPSAQNVTVKHIDAPVRTSTGSNKSDEHNQPQRRQSSYNNRDNKSQNTNRYPQGPKQQYQQRYEQQSRYPQQQQRHPQQSQQYRDYNRENNYRNYNDYRESYGSRQYMQPLRNVQRNDNWGNYGSRRINMNRGGMVQSAPYINQNRKPRNTLKFDDEYDFEQANSQFEEMRSQLAKTKLDDSYTKVNGDVDVKKEDSGNEVSGGEENEHESDDKQPVFYDKVKSFFDQISYEAIERSKGLTQRMDWKTERKINSETFGTVALRRNTNFRGRVGGGYYNYQGGRNTAMTNNYRNNNYNRQQQAPVQRKQYNMTANKNQDESKENKVA
ncbi:hypothetical protein PGB90_000858 [Kerria lacca]